MKILGLLTISLLFSTQAFPFANIDDAQWEGEGIITTTDGSFKVAANFSILATPDVKSEKFVSGGFAGKEIGVRTFEFWADFSDSENFKVFEPVERWYGNGYIEVGEGMCAYVETVGNVCRYTRLSSGSAISEMLIFEDDGDLIRNGRAVSTSGSQRVDYKLVLHPKKF